MSVYEQEPCEAALCSRAHGDEKTKTVIFVLEGVERPLKEKSEAGALHGLLKLGEQHFLKESKK